MSRARIIASLTVLGSVVLTFIAFACERTITNVVHEQADPASCFLCHSDDDTKLVAAHVQWSNSRHASGLNTNRNSPPCSGCHTSEGFKDRIAGNTVGTYPNPTVIHCFTCHAPHTNGNFTTRVKTPQALANGVSHDIRVGNICVACHVARRDVNTYVAIGSVRFTSAHWGPHYGTQGDMIFSSNGYEYDGYVYQDLGYHRTLTQDGCLDCHFRTTRNFVVGGHSFNMRALLADEIDVVDEHQDFTEVLNTAACQTCHGQLSNFNYRGVQDRVDVLADSLQTILVNAGLIDTTGHTIAGVSTSQDSAGAVWNFLVVHEDRSHGVHNSKYIIGLLESSIMYMKGQLPQPSSVQSAPWAATKEDESTALTP